jgi:hypothetical protein
MPNKFKYNKTGTEPNSIFKGNWAINNTPANTGGGPSSATSFYHGANIPVGGYTIYSSNGVYVAANDTELLGKLNSLGADADSVSVALKWAASQSTHVVLNKSIDNIVADGLVLNVDASHLSSFVNSEPTTNQVSNWNLNTGWAKGYQTDIVFDEIAPPTGISAPTVGFNKLSSSSYWYSYGDYTPQTPGATYVVSMYVMTNDPGFSINYYTADNSEAGRVWGPYIAVPNDGRWHRIIWPSFVNPAGSQSNSLSFNFSMAGGIANPSSRTWFCAPQMELGTVATPFVAGTRVQNTAWRDLSNNNNLATLVNGVTVDSNEGLSFDGVDEYAVLNTFSNKPTTAITCESLIKPMKSTLSGTIRGGAISASNSMYLGIIDSVDGGVTYAMHWANQTNSSRLYNWNGSVPNNRWSHLVGTYDGTTSRAYVNGVEISSWAQTGTIPDATYYIGTYGGTVVDGTHNFDGNIETARIYNKALTAAEIYQNYYGGPIVTSGLTYMWDAGNLVSYEPGSVTAYNLAGSKYATLTNGVGYNTGNGGHWTFDGSDDAIFIEGSLYSFNLNQNVNWTVNAWIKTTTTVAGLNEGGILSNSNGGPVYSNLQVYNGHIGYTHYNGSWQTSQGTKTVNDGTWHLLTWANIGNGNMNLYVDGAFDSTVNAQLSSSNAIDVIGRSWTGASFNGSIANVQVNFITMSQGEVLQNFNAYRNRFGI